MRDLDGDDTTLNYANIYSLNKTSEIEDGLSAILGFDFKINEKMTKKEKFSLSMGQVFNYEKNIHMCKTCGNSTHFNKVQVPYAFKLLLQELTMGIILVHMFLTYVVIYINISLNN